MTFQISNNNNYTTTPVSPNLYISKKLNNIDNAQVMKKKREDWTRMYYKTLKGLETMIDIQKMVKDMKKIAEETNIMITKIRETILMVSINNRTTNTMNIIGISKDLQYMVQSDMKDQAFQIQRMLANELDRYKRRGNNYIEENIQEI